MPDSEARSAFPEILKAYMEKNGYNQSDIAKYLHVSKQTVSEWVKGNKFPRVDKMQALADLFGVLMSDMYTPQKSGVVLKVNESRKRSFKGSLIKAVQEVGAFSEPFNFRRTKADILTGHGIKEVKVVKVEADPALKAMLKVWKVSDPKAKEAAVKMLETMADIKK